MSWIRDMERDAVAVAFPDWEWRDDDVVIVDQGWEEAGGYSEYNQWGASFETSVLVWRDDHTHDQGCDKTNCRRMPYTCEDAAEFWKKLMAKGSER